jgi:putative zinc finger/helix-turn-helix YgiT family protein
MARCSECRKGEYRPAMVQDSIKVSGHVFRTELPGVRCEECSDVAIDGPSIERFELMAAAHLARSGQVNGAILRFQRKAIGLGAKNLAELLGVAPETISRWENGKQPIDPLAAALVGAMALERAESRSTTAEALRAIRDPKPLGETIQIELAKAG